MVDAKAVERHSAPPEAEPRVLRLHIARSPQIDEPSFTNGDQIVGAHELVRLRVDERLARVEVADEQIATVGAPRGVPDHAVPERAQRRTL